LSKKFSDYQIYIFDLDGTLYDQPRLRKTMVLRLLSYYACHPFSLKELFLLQEFRKVKDRWTIKTEDLGDETNSDSGIGSVDYSICKHISEAKGISAEKITGIVKKWIYDNPVSALADARDDELVDIINRIRKSGKKVLVWSDYPVEDKLKALNVVTDHNYSSAEDIIGQLKPSAKGLEVIAQDFHADASSMIMIGDRMEKDGMAAKSFGCDYIILPRKIKNRKSAYESMRIENE